MKTAPYATRSAILTFAITITLPLCAGVTYQQTVRRGGFDGEVPVKSRVPSFEPPVFDIPVTLYAPPLEKARPEIFKMVVQGDRLVRIGKDDSTILDLQARTITIVRTKGHLYSIESLDDAQKRIGGLFHRWNSLETPVYKAETQKTGQTRQIEGQTAEEYRLLAIGVTRRRVGASSIYWIVPRSPSDELAAFQARWSRECTLAFPGMPTTPERGDTSVFGLMAQAASKLPGYAVLYVVESRPLRDAARLEAEGPKAMVPAGLTTIRVTEMTFSGFADAAGDPSVFAVPAGYKKTDSLKYMPD